MVEFERVGVLRHILGTATLAAAFVCAGGAPARAAEHVLLRNGFDLLCDHREAAGDGHVRLFLSPSATDFMEVDAADIVAVEAAPIAPASLPVAPVRPPAAQPTPAEMRQMLAKAGSAHDLDVDLLASIVRAESGGNARAVSRAGARGLMQLMPATAARLGVDDSFEPRQNIDGGTAYLNQLLARYHDNLALALAAYNAGPAAVDRYHGIPPYRETRAYVARVIHEFNRRKAEAARSHRGLADVAASPGIAPAVDSRDHAGR
jgi:soluble lytic murein transglycosylase-like protein